MINFGSTNSNTSMGKRATGFAAALAALVATASPAMAATVYVANNGIDAPACGTKAAPCRSITQGVTNAVDGDRISVGPGLYGDINGDDVLGGTGEEPLSVCGAETCMVNITKAVDVVSEAGAFSTLIRPPSGGSVDLVVAYGPTAPATFGGKGRGFTVDGTASDTAIVAGGVDVGIVGNVILASGAEGVAFVGTVRSPEIACCAPTAPARSEFSSSDPRHRH